MWEWWKGYLTAFKHIAAYADWTEPAVQFVVTLLAGAISLLVARKTIAHQEKVYAEKALRAERAAAGDAVTLAFHKLLDCGEVMGSMMRHLDDQFRTAAGDGYAAEPYQLIRPSIGRDYAPDCVSLSEVSFLSKLGDLTLIGDIGLIYQRTINCVDLCQRHSDERIAFHEWVMGLPGHKGDLQGDIAKDSIPVEFMPQFIRYAANLNVIIGSWVEQLDDSIKLVEDVLDRLRKAAKKEFGKDFPTIIASYPSASATIEDIRVSCKVSGVRFSL